MATYGVDNDRRWWLWHFGFGFASRRPTADGDGRQPADLPIGIDYDVVTDPEAASLVSSRGPDGYHRLVLDLDMEAMLVPSKTDGHHHLFVDAPMAWWKYQILLWVLMRAGVIDRDYYKACRRWRASMVWVPDASDEYKSSYKALKISRERRPVPLRLWALLEQRLGQGWQWLRALRPERS